MVLHNGPIIRYPHRVADDLLLRLGTDNDGILLNRSTALAADTALTNVLIGTPVSEALAANSIIISNVTAAGDVAIYGNRGGNSEQFLFMDVSAGALYLTPYQGGLMIALAADPPAPDGAAVHIWNGTAGVVTALAGSNLVIEGNTGNNLLTFMVTATQGAGIFVSEATTNTQAAVVYNYYVTDEWTIRTANVSRLHIGASTLAFQQAETISSTAELTLAPTAGNGSSISVKKATTELTAMLGASATATNLIPDGALVLAVVTRVTTLIEGASAYSIGDGSDVDRWGASIAVSAGTTSGHADYTATTVQVFTAANNVVLTAITSNFTAGAVRVTVYYIDATAPTS